VATIQSITDNRAALLDALTRTPVDKIPNGQFLHSTLTQALQLSWGADKAYLSWAQGGCPGAIPEPPEELTVTQVKQSFVDSWNTTIVGTYAAATAFRVDEI
jgi:hypothetical protein